MPDEQEQPEQYPGLRAAAHKLYELYSPNLYERRPWLQCIGEGAGKIVVYTRTKRVPVDIPAEVDGFPVEVKHIGRIVIR
jgi:hypothetical protein